MSRSKESRSRERYPWEDDGEVLVVETPEQTTVELRIASFGDRLVAAMIDRLILFVIQIAVTFPVVISNVVEDPESLGGWAAGMALALFWLSDPLYFVVAESAMSGRTPGKRLIGLRAVLGTGQSITLGASIIRSLARLVDWLPVLWIVPALTKGQRRIGDLLAGTVVLDENRNKADAPARSWLFSLAASWDELQEKRFPFLPSLLAQLTPDDLDLVEYLETRVGNLGRRQRQAGLRKVVNEYVKRLGLEEHQDGIRDDPERFLQELALVLRKHFDQVEV